MYQTVRQFAYARKDMLQEYLKTCKFVYFRKVVSVIYLIPVQNFYLLFRNTCCTKMNVIKYFFYSSSRAELFAIHWPFNNDGYQWDVYFASESFRQGNLLLYTFNK